jgi:RluA family pseudouridine synthase
VKRYTVQSPERLDAILAALGADAAAVADGRAFVNDKRVHTANLALRAGDVVGYAMPRLPGSLARISIGESELHVLHQDSELLVVAKPAGMSTIPDLTGSGDTLLAIAARHLGRPLADVHPTSRLDREVSGVVTFALSPRLREHLAHLRVAGTYSRRYVALAERAPVAAAGIWDAPIGRARDPRHRKAHGHAGLAAESQYKLIASSEQLAWLALTPITGRTHQLRVHAADANAPLWGDKVYGARTRVSLPSGRSVTFHRIALHAARVSLPLPNGKLLTCVAPLPADFRSMAEQLAQLGSVALPPSWIDGAWESSLT